MPKNSIEEYLYTLKPQVDFAAWRKATGSIDDIIAKSQNKFAKYSDALDIKQKAIADRADKLALKAGVEKQLKMRQDMGYTAEDLSVQSDMQYLAKLNNEIGDLTTLIDEQEKSIAETSKFSQVVGKAAPQLEKLSLVGSKLSATGTAVVDVFSSVIEKSKELAESASQLSNKFISSSSSFVDAGTKSTMARFGVSNTQAQSINASLDVLGLSADDLATLTQGQRKAFTDLIDIYQAGLDSIDPDKLEQFNAATQQYQMMQAEFTLNMQLALTKLFANSENLPELLDDMGNAFDKLVTLAESDAVRFAFDTLISFLDTFVDIVSFGAGIISGNVTTNNTNNTATQTNNFYGTTDRASLSSAIGMTGMQLQSVFN